MPYFLNSKNVNLPIYFRDYLYKCVEENAVLKYENHGISGERYTRWIGPNTKHGDSGRMAVIEVWLHMPGKQTDRTGHE